MKITPVLFCEKIEPILPFWMERLDFEKIVEVPEDGVIGFVIFQKGGVEIMFQTRASVAKDVPQLVDQAVPRAGTFIEVDDFDDVLKRMDGADVIMPERKTFYGMREILVREPGGNIICFAGRI